MKSVNSQVEDKVWDDVRIEVLNKASGNAWDKVYFKTFNEFPDVINAIYGMILPRRG